jgi:hypothetical protein
MNINLYEIKSGHYEHIYVIVKLYENKPGHYKHIYFNIKLYENKSGHHCNFAISKKYAFKYVLLT